VLDTTLPLDEQCAEIWRLTRETKAAQDRVRAEAPIVRIWDAEWNLQHVISGIEYQASFTWISNDTGPGEIEIPFDHPAAQWVHDSQGRIDRGEGRNVHITVDYCGSARWSGRLDKAVVESREDGDEVMVLTWAHDYENLKFYSVWSNPFLGPALQFPRSWLLAGPVTWILLTTLHLQLVREHNPLITIPDDPLDITLWDDTFDQSNWSVVVKPLSFSEAANSGVVWGVVSSRWATFHDMAKILLEDSELSMVCTRYLDGDPLPWDGANLRHGTLVISIEDKSGVYIGTSNGGSVLDGLVRTVAEFAEDFIDSTLNLLTDTEAPDEYFLPGFYATKPEWPYVVYRTGENSGIEASRFINSPSKAVQVNIGGHSMPGINEAISACLAPDTLIDGPDGKERIDVLTERGQPFRVWSLTPEGNRVAATASRAFAKGFAELFNYTMTDGRGITVTGDHRFLTPSGYKPASSLRVGDVVCIVDWSVTEADEPVRQVRDEDYVGTECPTVTVAKIQSAGWNYFYDMSVPGWENYAAHGIWNHNTIQGIGDLLGNVVLIGGLGGSIDALLQPLYEDTILAWQSVKSTQRAQNSGWSRYFEYFQDGANKSYTIAALMVLRAGFWSTRTVLANEMKVLDAAPFLIAPPPFGHFWLDDRIGFSLENDPTGQIWVDRARKIELKWDSETWPEWVPTIGDPRNLQDPATRAWGRIESMVAALRDLGVF